MWTGPFIVRPDLFADDAAQHTFWLYRYADPSLFPNDLSARFFSLISSAPWGYRALYAAIAPYVDVLFAGEVLAAVLVALSGWFAWLCGRAIVSEPHRDLAGLIAAAAAMWAIAQRADLLTPLALQRSFAFPIMLLFLWALISRRYAWVGVSWLLAALIYPVIIVVLGLTGAAVFLWDIVRERRMPPAWIWNGAAGIVALTLVIISSSTPPDIGPTVTGEEAAALAEFSDAGRLRLHFPSFTGDWFRNHLLGFGWPASTTLIIAVAAAISMLALRGERVPRAAWVLLACGIGTMLIARMTLFDLYLPNRHSRWAIGAFAVVAMTSAGVLLVTRAAAFVKARETVVASVASIGAIALVATAMYPTMKEEWRTPVDQDLEKAYDFLASLPRDTLVAAHPDLANFVPLRSQLSVVVSTEVSLPFMKGYYEALKPRLADSLRAAYATSWEELDSVLAPYGADVMLTGPMVWSRERYYAPFNELVAELRSRGEREGFVLKHPTPDRVIFQSGDVYVVRVGSASGSQLSQSAATPSGGGTGPKDE